MKLTIEQLSKLTKLSVPTIRVYASRKNLGKKVGTKRVFSQADVQKLLKGSKTSNGKTKGKRRTAKSRITKKPSKAISQKETAKPKTPVTSVETPKAKLERRSLWNRLFGTRKPKEKVKLLDARTTK
jgi:DNA-binding transcriptional MerR regulator